MLRTIIMRAAPACLLAFALFQVAPSGSPVASLDETGGLRRVQERLPLQASTEQAFGRHAVYEHLKILGIPADSLRDGMTRIDGLAQQEIIDESDLVVLANLAGDPGAAEKAFEILRSYAEYAAYGQPISGDLVVNDFFVPMVWMPETHGADSAGGHVELPGEPGAPSTAQPKIGGICLPCGAFDFGPFSPTPAYQFHASAGLVGPFDCAWYRFDVVAGTRYEFSTCAPGSAAWDTILEIYSSGCGVLGSNNNACLPGGGSTVAFESLAAGFVLVRVRSALAQPTGPYTLAYIGTPIVCETCPAPNQVPLEPPTASCQCFSNSTNTTCRRDFYEVDLIQGETYQFTTCQMSCTDATANYDSLLRLYLEGVCAAGTHVALNDDGGCGVSPTPGFNRSTMNYTATSTGTYILEVTGRTLGGFPLTGNYTLCYRRTSDACSGCPAGPYMTGANTVPTPVCQYHASALTGCEANWYDFLLGAGQTYEFATCATAACPGGGSPVDTILELYDAANCAGPPVATANDECGLQSRLSFSPVVGGNYRLRVRGTAAAVGPYTLSYREVGGCSAPSVVNIAPSSGAAAPGTCSRNEVFTVSVNGDATGPVTYAWTITPPPGGSANLPNGVVVSGAPGGSPANFGSLLTGDGIYQVCVTASNVCGSTDDCIAYELLDTQSPQVTAPADTAVACDAVPVADMAPTSDNCDPNPSTGFAEVRVDGPCQDTYFLERTWTATDRSDNVGSDMQVISVSDTEPPTFVGASGDVIVSCDAVPDPAGVTAEDNCDPSPNVVFNEVHVPGPCAGTYQLQRSWTATDRCGNVAVHVQVVDVVDDEPPVVTPSLAQVGCIWPPNHKWACFDLDTFGIVVTENCSEPVTWSVTSVSTTSTSTDPCGDGNHEPDYVINPDGSVCIRAERCGQERPNGGRTYTVEAVAVDACGNVSAPTPVGTIFVPHDQRLHPSCMRPSFARMP